LRLVIPAPIESSADVDDEIGHQDSRAGHPSSRVTDYCPDPGRLLIARCTTVTCLRYAGSAYPFRMHSPQRLERRGIRYSLNLPVSLTLAHQEVHARSENISLLGILLTSAFLIPEGSTVEVAVGVARLPKPGAQLSARGKVCRVQPKSTGNFAVAIAFEHPFEFGLHGLSSGSNCQEEASPIPPKENRVVASQRLYVDSAWHMET
jgi:hypothetical protein